MPFSHKCAYCFIDYISPKRNSKFCSSFCFGKSNADKVIANNKARRKYPEIEGLNRRQAHYRGTNGKDAYRDIEKRHNLIKELGGKCVCCGYDKNIVGLVLDHINGDGGEDRKRIGTKIARYYVNHIDEAKQKLQVLCATCNQIKAYEEKEHNKTRRVIKEVA